MRRKTKYVPGYGYITQHGSGFWQDAGTELMTNVGKKVASAIGDRVGSAIAKKIVGKKPTKKTAAANGSATRESVFKELELIPAKTEEFGLSEDVRKSLYGSGIKTKTKTKQKTKNKLNFLI